MNELQIQLPALPASDVQMLLDGLKAIPLGRSYDLFTRLFNEAQKQINAAAQAPQPTAPE